MSSEATPTVPPNGRLIAAGLAIASAVGLALNHLMAGSQSVVQLIILCIGPIGLFLGLGGIIEPKILWSVGKHGRQLPVVYKLIGGVLGALGVVVTIVLMLFVYQPPAAR